MRFLGFEVFQDVEDSALPKLQATLFPGKVVENIQQSALGILQERAIVGADQGMNLGGPW